MEIRDILKEEMDKFTDISNEIVDNQHDFEKITENYNKYNDLIDKGKTHISDLRRREFYENLFIYIGYYFFFVCVGYVLLKRFPVHKIIGFIFKIIYKIVKFVIPSKNSSGEMNHYYNITNQTNTTDL